ncbi:MAG: hypothetical protein R3F60_26220 [bacterium]
MIRRLRRLLGMGPRGGPAMPPSDDASVPVVGENLLLISDLHLGEACKEHSRIEYLKRGAEYDAHICAFLDHYTHHRPGGRPWRLVLGGDLFDFLQVTIVPDGADEEARRYGLGTREEESAWKLARLMERHRSVFVFLAGFIGAGHRVEVVQGNHDEELFWPRVRDALVQGLVDLFFGGEDGAGDDPEAFASRIHFNAWVYSQPGLLYVEHGHRFDEFCTTPPQLCPLRPQAEDELSVPMSGLAIRYFANLERGFKTHDKEHWRVPDYVRYYKAQGSLLKAVAGVGHRYMTLVARAVSYHLQHGRFQSEQAEAAHQERARELCERADVTPEQLGVLESLGASSVMASPLGIYAILGMGEMTSVVAALLTLILLLCVEWGAVIELGIFGLVLGAGYAWSRFVRSRFPTDIQRKLDEKAEAISRLLDVPVVAMGHCHRARRRRMDWNHRRFYINTGNFIAPEVQRHRDGERCSCPTTFVELHDPGPKVANPLLKRWCCVKNEALTYEPSTPR